MRSQRTCGSRWPLRLPSHDGSACCGGCNWGSCLCFQAPPQCPQMFSCLHPTKDSPINRNVRAMCIESHIEINCTYSSLCHQFVQKKKKICLFFYEGSGRRKEWKHLWLKPRRQTSSVTFQLEQGFIFPAATKSTRFYFFQLWPVFGQYLVCLTAVWEHDDSRYSVLENHGPEVSHGVWQRRLCYHEGVRAPVTLCGQKRNIHPLFYTVQTNRVWWF